MGRKRRRPEMSLSFFDDSYKNVNSSSKLFIINFNQIIITTNIYMDWSAWGSFLYAEEGKTTKATTKDLFKRIYPLVKPFLRWVILTLVVIGISTAINMIPPLLTRALIDHILIEKDKTALTW